MHVAHCNAQFYLHFQDVSLKSAEGQSRAPELNVPMLWGGVANQPWGRVTLWAVRWAERTITALSLCRDLQPQLSLPAWCTGTGDNPTEELCWTSLGTGDEAHPFGS